MVVTRIIGPEILCLFFCCCWFSLCCLGYLLVLQSCFSWFVWFSLWFWLSQWSSHLYRFGFLVGFTHSFCDQSCLKLHPVYYFSRPLFALPTRMSHNVWIQRVALQLASVRVRPY